MTKEILQNEYLITVAFSWILAQTLKIIFASIKDKKLALIKFFQPGGMPSSHTTPAAALTTLIALQDGLGNPLFVLSLLITLIIMHDAAGVRYKAGEHAKTINKIIEELSSQNILIKEKYKKHSEFIGHTLPEVIGGAVVGIVCAIFLYYRYFI